VLADVVVDTNVFVHGSDAKSLFYAQAFALLQAIQNGNVILCLDRDMALPPDPNNSLIASEYLRHVRPTMYGYQVLVQLLTRRRVRAVGKTIAPPDSRILLRLVPNPDKQRDRTFVAVAMNSQNRVFVSHDREDFPPKVRDAILARLRVEVIEAAACTARL